MPDSSGTQPPVSVQLAGDSFAVTLFRCHLDLVNQTAVLDAQSLQVLSLELTVVEPASTWSSVSWTPQAPPDVNDPLGVPSVSLADIVSSSVFLAPG
jgi:hypothetical protein